MIRVAGPKQQKAAGVRKRDASGLTPSQQLLLIASKVRQMVAQQATAIADVFERLAGHGFYLVRWIDWTPTQRQFLAKFFTTEVLPVLTPLGVEELSTRPLLPGLQLFVALLVDTSKAGKPAQKLVVIPVPTAFNRFVNIPTDKGTYVAPLEEVILDNAKALFGGGSSQCGARCRGLAPAAQRGAAGNQRPSGSLYRAVAHHHAGVEGRVCL
jgi:polyphosphate kinase